jgi:hypothetical protein
VQDSIEGTYEFADGAFVADAGMQAINERIGVMRLLADKGEGRPLLRRSQRRLVLGASRVRELPK